ncbi:MAG: hypothetical protein DRJ09_02695, partial [Bacteroidetes bacterium]
FVFDEGRINVKNTGSSVFMGNGAGNSDDLTSNMNVFVGDESGYSNTTGSKNTSTGYRSLHENLSGNKSTAFGFNTLFSNTTGHSSVAVGASALYKNTVKSNLVAIGDSALFNNGTGATIWWESSGNTAIGSKTLFSNTRGYRNTAIGFKALYSNTTGNLNTANGYEAMYSNTTGYKNTVNGYEAMYSNTTGYQNTANGYYAMFSNTSGYRNSANGYNSLYYNTTGSNNTANGSYALYNNTTGTYNAAVGLSSSEQNLSGIKNTSVGCFALSVNETGNNNTAVGYDANVVSSNLHYATALGSEAYVNQSNSLVLGGTDTAYVRVGIGTGTPGSLLDVVSQSSTNADVRILSPDSYKSSLKLFEQGNYGYELQYDGNVDKLFLWSRTFVNNEGIRMTWLKNGNVGIGTQTPSYRLQVGEAGDGSQARANAWNTFSDRRWKTNITKIDNPITKLQNINGYYYNWKSSKDKSRQVGVIAQEVESVLPEIVSTDENGYKSLDYSKLTPLLIEAVKQQQKTITELQQKLQEMETLKQRLDKIEKLISGKQ